MNIQPNLQQATATDNDKIGSVVQSMFNSYCNGFFDHGLSESDNTAIINRLIKKINEISPCTQISPLVSSDSKNPTNIDMWDWSVFVNRLYPNGNFFKNSTNSRKLARIALQISRNLTNSEVNKVIEETNKFSETNKQIRRGIYLQQDFDVYSLFTKYGQMGISIDVFIKNAIKFGLLPKDVITEIYSEAVK